MCKFSNPTTEGGNGAKGGKSSLARCPGDGKGEKESLAVPNRKSPKSGLFWQQPDVRSKPDWKPKLKVHTAKKLFQQIDVQFVQTFSKTTLSSIWAAEEGPCLQPPSLPPSFWLELGKGRRMEGHLHKVGIYLLPFRRSQRGEEGGRGEGGDGS